MKKHLKQPLFMLALTSWPFLTCLPSLAQTPSPAEQALIQLQHQWARARIKGDVPFLEKLYAKEFRITALDGSVVTREADIAVFASGDMKPEIIEDTAMQAAQYGTVALVTGLEHVRGTCKGNPGEFTLRFTNVFVQREKRWQLVTHHSTKVRQK